MRSLAYSLLFVSVLFLLTYKYLFSCQINQLEKDKDVIAQAHAIAMLETSPQLSFSIVSALNNFLNDSKVVAAIRAESLFEALVKWNMNI